MELKITLQPKQREALEKSERTPVLFYGGAKGGGKSYLVRAREVKRRLSFPNTKGLIVRKTFPELLANHIRPFFKEYPETRKWYNKAEKTIYWPNGSTTEFSYLGHTDDVYTYQGREYDDEAIDEVTQHEWEVVRILRSSLRTSNPQINPTMLLTGNPGGIGHQDVKRIFIDRRFNEEENPKDYDFVQAFVSDNQALMDADPEYIKRLNDLPDRLRKAYLDGDWNIFAGIAFEELCSIHIVEPFRLPQNTRFLTSFDYGYAHPFYWTLIAITPDEKVYIVDTLTGHKKRIDEIGTMILKKLDDWNVDRVLMYSGTDIWSKKDDRDPIYEELNRVLGKRVGVVRAYTDRKAGVAEMRRVFAWRNTQGGDPQLKFFKNTIDLYEQIRGMQTDPDDPEDVIKVNADEDGNGGDDGYDSARYGIMARLYPNPEPTPEIKSGTGAELLEFVKMQQRMKKWAS